MAKQLWRNGVGFGRCHWRSCCLLALLPLCITPCPLIVGCYAWLTALCPLPSAALPSSLYCYLVLVFICTVYRLVCCRYDGLCRFNTILVTFHTGNVVRFTAVRWVSSTCGWVYVLWFCITLCTLRAVWVPFTALHHYLRGCRVVVGSYGS